MNTLRRFMQSAPLKGFAIAAAVALSALAPLTGAHAQDDGALEGGSEQYVLGPGDVIQIFVWRSEELSETITVRPDGRVTTKLLEDVQAAGRTPTALARQIEDGLAQFVQAPIVTVIVTEVGEANQQNVKVLGQAIAPRQLPYFDGMTVLDVIVAVGGLTEIADGNRAVLVREDDDRQISIPLRLDDLLSEGDVSADQPVRAGDTIIIPETWL